MLPGRRRRKRKRKRRRAVQKTTEEVKRAERFRG
jgi:hypothetical protein